jgi:hypothetical protein
MERSFANVTYFRVCDTFAGPAPVALILSRQLKGQVYRVSQ